MMLTDRIERDVLDHHHLVVTGLEGDGQVAVGAVLDAAEDLVVHRRHALGRTQQTVAVGILTDGLEDLLDGLLDPNPVYAFPVAFRHAGLGRGRGFGTERATRRRAGLRAGAVAGGVRDGRFDTGPRTAMTSGVSCVSFSTWAEARRSSTLRFSVRISRASVRASSMSLRTSASMRTANSPAEVR